MRKDVKIFDFFGVVAVSNAIRLTFQRIIWAYALTPCSFWLSEALTRFHCSNSHHYYNHWNYRNASLNPMHQFVFLVLAFSESKFVMHSNLENCGGSYGSAVVRFICHVRNVCMTSIKDTKLTSCIHVYAVPFYTGTRATSRVTACVKTQKGRDWLGSDANEKKTYRPHTTDE